MNCNETSRGWEFRYFVINKGKVYRVYCHMAIKSVEGGGKYICNLFSLYTLLNVITWCIYLLPKHMATQVKVNMYVDKSCIMFWQFKRKLYSMYLEYKFIIKRQCFKINYQLRLVVFWVHNLLHMTWRSTLITVVSYHSITT